MGTSDEVAFVRVNLGVVEGVKGKGSFSSTFNAVGP